MKITALKDTVIKAENIDSDDLNSSEKANFPKGGILDVETLYDDLNQHARIELEQLVISVAGTPIERGFIYTPHWELPRSQVKLDVPYFNQVDNSTNLFGTGHRQCNLTANAMALEFLLEKYGQETLSQKAVKGGFREPESVYAQVLKKYGDTIFHEAQTKALRDFGVQSYFSSTLSMADAIACLKAGFPVPVSIAYKSSGHIILLVGFDDEQSFFWVHDPYGSRAGSANYYSKIGGDAGKYDKYSFDTMSAIWRNWGRVFTSVAGNFTGLASNL